MCYHLRTSFQKGAAVAVLPPSTKSWVVIGGRYPDSAFSGAPNIPGIMYTTNENTAIAAASLLTERCSTGASCANRIFPEEIQPEEREGDYPDCKIYLAVKGAPSGMSGRRR